MTARRSRLKRTMAEAEAWREGYEAARRQAGDVVRTLATYSAIAPRPITPADLGGVADAIARMEPEPEGRG